MDTLTLTHADTAEPPSPLRLYVVVHSSTSDYATVRMHSEALLQGLQQTPGISARLHRPAAHTPLVAEGPTVVLFRYGDDPAIRCIQAMRRNGHEVVVICFGSDVYSFDLYRQAYGITDLFVMPSEDHRKILSSFLYKPVFALPEAIDRIAGEAGPVPATLRKTRKRIAWFGYAESFFKAMASVTPVIQRAQAEGLIEDFTVVVDQHRFPDRFGLKTLPFSSGEFRQVMAGFDYCLLSHLPLDLAVNSWIKSSNKLVTSLLAGLVPIASDTPNYRAELEPFGLERLLFASPADLYRILADLDPATDSAQLVASGIVPSLLQQRSPIRIATQLRAIVERYRNQPDPLRGNHIPLSTTLQAAPPFGVAEHVRDLGPSILRSLRRRLPGRAS